MPRLAVYVPDELWSAVQKTRPKMGTSAIVQEGIKRLLHREDVFAGSRLSVGEDDRLADVVTRLKIRADEEYKQGFEKAVELLDTEEPEWPYIDWEMLDMLVEDWDLVAWIRRVEERWPQSEWVELWETVSHVASDSDPIGGLRSSAYLAGYGAALKEVWTRVANMSPEQPGSNT